MNNLHRTLLRVPQLSHLKAIINVKFVKNGTPLVIGVTHTRQRVCTFISKRWIQFVFDFKAKTVTNTENGHTYSMTRNSCSCPSFKYSKNHTCKHLEAYKALNPPLRVRVLEQTETRILTLQDKLLKAIHQISGLTIDSINSTHNGVEIKTNHCLIFVTESNFVIQYGVNDTQYYKYHQLFFGVNTLKRKVELKQPSNLIAQ